MRVGPNGREGANWRSPAPWIALTVASLVITLTAMSLGPGLWARRIRAVRFPGGVVAVETAVTTAERRAGLAGRWGLPPNTGLLFVYPDMGPRHFTMDGMLFPLDMITLDSAGVVVSVVTCFPGEGGRDIGPAHYVLEVEGGWAAFHGVGPGTRSDFIRDPPP